MIERRPPRFAEALLESFGADPELEDAVIGDLAQEHAQRAERHGPTAARLWYCQQAMFAAPALMRSWFGRAGWRDVRRLLNVAGLAYATVMLINMGLMFTLVAVGAPHLAKPLLNSLVSGGALVMSIASPVIIGYVAAIYEESRPMIAALATLVFWLALQALGALWIYLSPELHFGLSSVARAATVPFFMAAFLLGGALRVRRVSGLRAVEASSSPS